MLLYLLVLSEKYPSTMSAFRSLLHIPVRRHHGDFDDFFMNRWHELNPVLLDDELQMAQREWQSRMEDMRRNFFHFSPMFGELTEHFADVNTIHPVCTSLFFNMQLK